MKELFTYKINIQGIVQGVGFRPYIFGLAERFNLKGTVLNSTKGVEIFVTCTMEIVEDFLDMIKKSAPPLSHITSIEYKKTEYSEYKSFDILKSENTVGITLISPDSAVCKDCCEEIFDKDNRRYMYPFTNCTNCGPRYSIISKIPYDRPNTTMKNFDMCPECFDEYTNPLNRRFHAQPNCCLECGPNVYSGESKGLEAIDKTAQVINSGGVAAVKGLGGYHLICDAKNHEAVKKLRERKHRPEKPFAIMVKDIETLGKYKDLSETEKRILNSPQAPILLIEWKNVPFDFLVNPVSGKTGVMTAYTPLHKILMSKLNSDFIIATSGNLKDEPICHTEEEAEKKLGSFVDIFLHHDREIQIPIDDSVAAVFDDDIYIIRRARGFAPYPVMLPEKISGAILGVGAHLKSTVTLGIDNFGFVSQYIGDLDNAESSEFYERICENMIDIYGIDPKMVVADMHPEYFSSKFAEKLNTKTIQLQHHYAHMYSVMAENGLSDNLIGVIYDGTGLGFDNKIWGGEIFSLINGDVYREYHLEYAPMPGLDAAAKNPGRMLISYLVKAGVYEKYADLIKARINFKVGEADFVANLCKTGVNSVDTCGMGRLFESMGSFFSGKKENSFEAHQAVYLESIADYEENSFYDIDLNDRLFSGEKIVVAAIEDFLSGTPASKISAKFHNTIINLTQKACNRLRAEKCLKDVVLSGGVFQNMYILQKLSGVLKADMFNVFTHSRVPSNDGAISLGQVYFALLNKEKI